MTKTSLTLAETLARRFNGSARAFTPGLIETTITEGNDGKITTLWYHRTAVATLTYHDLDGPAITLKTGGWQTVTTKKRINAFFALVNAPYHLYQDHYRWYLYDRDHKITRAFVEGMTLRLK